jgi:hypothetical protein
MAAHRGCFGRVYAAGDQVVQATEVRFARVADEIDISVADGTTLQTIGAGDVRSHGSLVAWWDPADTGQENLSVGDSVSLTIYPEGTGGGARYYTGNVVILSEDVSFQVDGLVGRPFTWAGHLNEATV